MSRDAKPAPAPAQYPGKVNFNADVGTLTINVELTRPLDIMPTIVTLSMLDFLEISGQIQTAAAGKLRAILSGPISVVPPPRGSPT